MKSSWLLLALSPLLGAATCDDPEPDPCADMPRDSDGDGDEAIRCGGTDCNDQDRWINPGAMEICDHAGRDEDCNPESFGSRDDDHDSQVDWACFNVRADGTIAQGPDCDDSDINIVQAGVERRCNGRDDNCDGTVDEGVQITYYPDLDGDGHGAGTPVMACSAPAGYSALGNDCDDTNPAIQPGAMTCLVAKPTQYQICASDGMFAVGTCPGTSPGTCVDQPNGLGECN